MFIKRLVLTLALSLYLLLLVPNVTQAYQASRQHTILPGDTWTALTWQYNVTQSTLQSQQKHLNPYRQPTIGTTFIIPTNTPPQSGQLVYTNGRFLNTALIHNLSPWHMTLQNGHPHPYYPTFHHPLFVPDDTAVPRELPPAFKSLELSHAIAYPGQAVGLRAQLSQPISITAQLDGAPIPLFNNNLALVGLTGTGAFYAEKEPALTIQVAGQPLWSQPWRFDKGTWTFQQLTLTGAAATITQADIQAERERLFTLWRQATPSPQWQTPFQFPINDYLTITSNYGARRSYNDGPYSTYHEGVDFSAYGGTAVTAAAAGTVIIAEVLDVRGGTVIIDHGLGIYTGYYHLSHQNVTAGQTVVAGQPLGEVGTTGLSTGNHLHWDLLVNAIWVDALAWLDQDMGCWLREGLDQGC